jgi:hypothetical protein
MFLVFTHTFGASMSREGECNNHFILFCTLYNIYLFRQDETKTKTTGSPTNLVSLAIDLFHILKTRFPQTSLATTVTSQSASSPLATILDRQIDIAVMAEYLFALLETSLVLDASTHLASVPDWSVFEDAKTYVAGPAPGHVGVAAVVRETPHRVNSADFRAAGHTTARAAQACGCRAPEFGVEGVEDPDVVLGVFENVDVHFFEHVEGEYHVGLEAEG